MTEEVQEAQAEEQPQNVLDFLKNFEGAPTPEMIESHKALYGDVFITALSESEVFIFRSLNRNEYRTLQEQQQQVNPHDQEEQTVKICLLWASVDPLSKAGTVPTLLEQILQNSNFVPPQVAMNLVTKL